MNTPKLDGKGESRTKNQLSKSNLKKESLGNGMSPILGT